MYVADERLPRNVGSGSPAFSYPPLKISPKKLNGTITTKVSSNGRVLVDGGRALTSDEVTLLLTHSLPQHWATILTFIYTGMRIGEVLAMQWKYLTEGDDALGLYAVELNLDKQGNLDGVKTASSRAELALSSVVVKEQRSLSRNSSRAKIGTTSIWYSRAWATAKIGVAHNRRTMFAKL